MAINLPPPPAPNDATEAKRPWWRRKRIVVPAAVVLLIIGIAVTGGGESTSDDGADDATVAAQTTADESTASSETDEVTTPSAATEEDGASLEEIDDARGCERTASDSITVELVNQSSKTSSYILTIGYFDDGHNRVADSNEFINYVRAGERVIEPLYTFEEAGVTCEVLDVERFAAESDPDEMEEVSPCTIGPADALGHATATVDATNGTPEPSNYLVTVAFVTPDGVRIGDGSASMQTVRPGETAPADVFTVVSFQEGLTCAVVAVDRFADN